MTMKTSGFFFLFYAACLISTAEEKSQQLKSKRCDQKFTYTRDTLCTSCTVVSRLPCPKRWTKLLGKDGQKNCRYTLKLGETTLSLPGCAQICKQEFEEKRCCPGFWGPACYECPVGSGNVCSGRGTCLEGSAQNGTCICEEKYSGYACQDCLDETRFGPDCQSVCECQHGICNHGPSGDGSCTCYAGYTGPKCDQELLNCGGVICEANSICVVKGGQPRCECLPGYKKNGIYCQDQDPCSSYPCSSFATCKTLGPNKYECTCKAGYLGNGKICQPINPCLTDNGGCPRNSSLCSYIRPGEARCLCKPGFIRHGDKDCFSTLSCQPHNCDRSAKCEIDPDASIRCTCKDGEIGDGRKCYKTFLGEISSLNVVGRNARAMSHAIKMFEMGCSFLLENHGPLTVLVPANLYYDRMELNETLANNLCKLHIIPGLHLVDHTEKDLWTLAGPKVIFSSQGSPTKNYRYSDEPAQQYFIRERNLPAANGIIHIVSMLRKNPLLDNLSNSQKTIGEILVSMEIASRFETILENCGLPSFLDGPGPFTVFVPSNEAVDKLRDGRLIYLFTEGINKLQELVKHHIYTKAAVDVETLITLPQILTMANQVLTIHFSEEGRILLGDSEVALNTRNILASNGIIHTLDGIFIPPSIIPILPHRCNEKDYKVVAGSCVDCSALNTSVCPPESTVMAEGIFPGECVYIHDPLGLNIMKKGCKRNCNQTVVVPGCCKGFFGSSCTPCPSGFTNPCYGKGTCNDGIRGNGQCHCHENFRGIACHICSNPNKHGENCDEDCGCVHGICDNRPGSKGVCQPGSCKAGYSGEFCDRSSQKCASSDDAPLNCHLNAVCIRNDTVRCVCLDGYEGDGFSCEPIDVCSKPEQGGCSKNAMCTSTGPGTATCQCNKGWTGDGKDCIAIDNCAMETRGGCHVNADCIYIGPGQSSCICKRNYNGDGYSCDPVAPCSVDNGGCHELATCQSLSTGEKACRCSDGYMGDGVLCYGNIMKELVRNYHFSDFYGWIKKSLFSIPEGTNLTVLVPVKEAIQNLSKDEKDFWLQPDMLLLLVRGHFLLGSFTTEQLKKYVGQELPTLSPRIRWKINNSSGAITIQNASIVLGDIPAINSTIYIINKVLLPTLDDIPPRAPGLQQQLNATPSFSSFKELLEQYHLIAKIESSEKYTIFVPGNSAIEKYCQDANITQLDMDTVQYHVVLGVKLLATDLKSGVHKTSMLGFSYWLMFYKNTTQAYVNKVLLNGQFVETTNGMLIGVSEVLRVQKNRCSINSTTVQKTRCAKCDKKIRCPNGSVLAGAPANGSFPHCVLKSQGRRSVGCHFTCIKVSLVSVCCSGYYGHMCEMCPGKPDRWCSGNGVCQDGIDGNGECQCHEGYHGTACEMCQPGRYGANCKSECNCAHGICNDGLLGDGSCTCAAGFKGVSCDIEVKKDFCNGTCDEHANCVNDSTTSQPTCLCSAGYNGNGTSCTEIDPCAVGNGGCSPHASCTKVGPGQRTCSCKEGYAGDGTLCREIDLCLDKNGGCHQFAECVKTGPGLVACNCLPGFTGDGVNKCERTNPCKENNGGCSPHALCLSTSGDRICICLSGTGDGFICTGSVWQELSTRQAASKFVNHFKRFSTVELTGSGPFTVFVPHADYIKNSTTFSEWEEKGFIKDLLNYHIVICHKLQSEDLQLKNSITALSGLKIKVSMKENSVYLNDEAKIIESDIMGNNGVLHFIDKILIPYDLQNINISSNLAQETITEVADAYGYKIYSKLLVEAGLLNLVNSTLHQPFTMLWPTDAAFNSLPEDMQKWLYHREHRSKLAAYLKGHMIRDTLLSGSSLMNTHGLRTMHGSLISFGCSKTSAGEILVNNGNARIVQQLMKFNGGIAYGIDQVLEPPDLGSRCDEFRDVERPSAAACGSCGNPPHCSGVAKDRGETQSCYYYEDGLSTRPWYSLSERRSPWLYRSHGLNRWRTLSRSLMKGCRRTCFVVEWVPQCCPNHYGKDCQVCPGGLKEPCSNHGTCNDGQQGSGWCSCDKAFIGTACENCAPGHYGPECKECNCTSNGICDEGLHGDGFCFCSAGWTGERCETELAAVPVCSPACHRNAVCRSNNTCECSLHYEGDGWTCKVIDRCAKDNGDCSDHANCTQIGIDVSCSCFPDYEGDGYICSPIDRCADGMNGDCSEHATCINTGPNSRRCECHAGYIGNGIQCLEEAIPPIDRCLENNGQCHSEALCSDLHFEEKTVGVFHLQSPQGKYRFTYQEAEAACAAEGATVATLKQLSAAQQMGFHQCIVGWLYNRSAGYPTVYPSLKCGSHHVGIVDYGFRSNASEKWDAYCYRVQDVQCVCRDGFVGDGYTCTGSLVAVLAQKANFSVYYSMVLDYANATQEGWEFFNFLSTDMTYKTLFVPLNSGFQKNASLTLNDLKLHSSARDVALMSFNLTSGTVIPSQAGFNLSIADSTNNTLFPQGCKMINNSVIVEWDILASNGIIHAIEAPLMAPQLGQLDQVVGAVKSPAAVTISVSIVVSLVLCAMVAGMSYIYLKRKNQGFQFRYFKAELEDDEPSPWEERSPHLVSIPNPIYGADISIYEPFEDSLTGEDFSDAFGIRGDQ
ncbi:stabilin-1 isoform X1 [Podarcis raffonei]|uniref:stabilin-1 isoform X1 n=1 Tax=Podarcis raffonei TaxID=65483 RepID=UPI0023294564|nr:stabilin-1 isoform X1 [Podarcis raffonei]